MAAPGRQPLIVGNWKMNLSHLEAIALVQKLVFSLREADYQAAEVVVLPAFPALRSIQTLVDGDRLQIRYGAQDLSPHPPGAYTGDVAGSMLAKLGCSYVTVGHSERRQYHAESDSVVNAKVQAAYAVGITPILCVGEALDVRRGGGHIGHVLGQLTAGLAGVPAESAASAVVAYEPVWAIGTGETATPADAQEVCAEVRGRLARLYSARLAAEVRVLYGGSVTAAIAPAILAAADVDGALVGGASLDAEAFAAIVRSGGPR